MKFKRILALFLVSMLVFAVTCLADGYDYAYKNVNELETATSTASGDLILVYDASEDKGKTMDAQDIVLGDDITIDGDLTFQTTLIANGRVNATLTLASSSTVITGTSIPYSYIAKSIGDGGGLDETDGGIRLGNAKPGQILVIAIVDPVGSGTLIVTPDTTTGFTTLTFDAALDTATLYYFNDTLGWILISSTSVTVA